MIGNKSSSMSSGIYTKIDKELQKRNERSLLRELKTSKGKDFCSNDYLGLANHPKILEAMHEGINHLGLGSTASRLVRGHYQVFNDLEDVICEITQTISSLFVANGFVANLGLIDALSDSRTQIFTDRLNHASILDGIRIAGSKKIYFNHLDYDDLEAKLKKSNLDDSKIIIAESIYSMDGDRSDVKKLVDLKIKYNACLILDETHAFGVEGRKGSGLGTAYSEIDFRIFTLGKALGLEGGIIACNTSKARDYLINCMRSFVFSTAPMPAIAYAGITALHLMSNMDREREHLAKVGILLREGLQAKSFQTGNSTSQIVPVLLNSEEEALAMADKFQKQGFDLRAIRPPTVPTPRIRISLHSNHTEFDVACLVRNF